MSLGGPYMLKTTYSFYTINMCKISYPGSLDWMGGFGLADRFSRMLTSLDSILLYYILLIHVWGSVHEGGKTMSLM